MIQLIISETDSELNVEEFCHCANISENILHDLVEHSIAIPIRGVHSGDWLFNVAAVSLVKKATRIHHDLAIEWAGIALVLNLLGEIDALKMENEKLKKQLSRFVMSESNA